MTSRAVVCDAIRRRRLLELTYRGAVRLVEPYSHGVSHDGRQILVAYQRAAVAPLVRQGAGKRFTSTRWTT
jgi:hypothetical protein